VATQPRSPDPAPDITALLVAWSHGDRAALDQLIPVVHHELLKRARAYLARERADCSLASQALVNEAYLRMVDMRRVDWKDRAHFFAIAARQMRHVLVDLARARRARKRGGLATRVPLEDAPPPSVTPDYDLLAVNQALDNLAIIDPRRGRVVELRLFGGLTIEETAAVLKVSSDTVLRDWKLAKHWLARELAGGGGTEIGHDT
jgi:RNA polymerase sigma factor (TIGR02999 family)